MKILAIGAHFDDAVTNITAQDNPDFFTGLSINFPLENSLAKSKLKASELEKAKVLLNTKLLERKIAIAIMDRVMACNILKELALTSKEIAQLQTKKLDEEEKQFKYGRSNTDTIIRFQEDAILAQWKALQDKFNYAVAEIDLRLKEGTLLGKYWRNN